MVQQPFERLYMAFTNFWSRKGFELQEQVSAGGDRVSAGGRMPSLPRPAGRRGQFDHRLLQLQTNRMVMAA